MKFDDENNVVYFQGVITSKDFKSFLENSFEDYFDLQVDINEFQGGIDRLINYVQILDNDSLPHGIPYDQFLEYRSKSIEKNRNKVNKKNQKKDGRVASDSIGYYLSSIGRVPLLSSWEELELFQYILNMRKIKLLPKSERSSKQRNAIKIGKRARDRIMAANLRLVVSVAKKYQNQGLELLDLVQEGAIGLERAVDKFDPAMGYKFSTYAYWWIRQSIVRVITLKSTINELPVHATEFLNKLKKARRELIRELSRVPTVSELAKSLEIPVEEIKDLMSKVCQIAGFQIKVGDEDFTIFLNLFSRIEVDWQSLLNKLPDSQCKVLKMRYGIDEYKQKSHTDIGNVLGISIDMAHTLEFRGLRRLIRLSVSNNVYFS